VGPQLDVDTYQQHDLYSQRRSDGDFYAGDKNQGYADIHEVFLRGQFQLFQPKHDRDHHGRVGLQFDCQSECQVDQLPG